MLRNRLILVAILLSNIFCGMSAPGQAPTTRQSNKPTSLWTRQKGDDWPAFLGLHGEGTSNETGIRTDWRNGKLAVVWKKDLGEGYGIGAVAEGRYFQFDRQGEHARVRCFNAETGADLWKFEYRSEYRDLYGYDSGPRTSPIVDRNRVYVFGVEGLMHCLSAETGDVIWKLDTQQKWGVIQNFFGVASSPVISGDLILVMVGGSPPESQNVPPGALDQVQPNGSGMVALDKFTGEVRYQIADELASYAGIRLATLGDRPVGYAWLRGSLIGFDVATGTTFLNFPYRHPKLESVNASTPVVRSIGDTNQVFLSECYGLGSVLLSITNEGHEIVWSDQGRRNKSMEAHWNTPILIDGSLFGCSGRHPSGAELRCVNWESGVVRWAQPGFERSSLTAIDGHFILLDEAGRLVLIKQNVDRFEKVTEYDGEIRFKSPCWAAPIVSHGLLYVRGRDQVVCFDLQK